MHRDVREKGLGMLRPSNSVMLLVSILMCLCSLVGLSLLMLRPSNSLCCSFRYLCSCSLVGLSRLFNCFPAFISYITPPTLISFSYPYYHYKLFTYLLVCKIVVIVQFFSFGILYGTPRFRSSSSPKSLSNRVFSAVK